MGIKVITIKSYINVADLDEKVNDWLSLNWNKDLIDIKFCVDDRIYYAMIIYR